MKKKGYTLIEMLVIIAVIMILGSIIVPSYRLVLEKVNRASCANNLRQFGMSFRMYYSDYGIFPLAGTAMNRGHRLFYPLGYIADPELYICPSDGLRDVYTGTPAAFDTTDAQNNYDSYFSRVNPAFSASPAQMDANEKVIMARYYPATGGDDGVAGMPFCPEHEIDSKRVLMYDDPLTGTEEYHGNGRNYLFVDGTVIFWTNKRGWPDYEGL